MKTTKINAEKLIQLASIKGYSITRFKTGVYQYSKDGFNWTNVECNWNEFVKVMQAL